MKKFCLKLLRHNVKGTSPSRCAFKLQGSYQVVAKVVRLYLHPTWDEALWDDGVKPCHGKAQRSKETHRIGKAVSFSVVDVGIDQLFFKYVSCIKTHMRGVFRKNEMAVGDRFIDDRPRWAVV